MSGSMRASSLETLVGYRVLKSEPGYAALGDGSLIFLRAAVVAVRHVERETPFKPEFEVDFTVGISVKPSDKALKEVENKPIAASPDQVREGWMDVEITEAHPAREEVIYLGLTDTKYVVVLEVEPLMAAKNTSYRTPRGSPIYVLRWAPKVWWRKAREETI